MRVAELLNIGRGVTALIGGGGKTTLLETLARELAPCGRVILCASTHILRPEALPIVTGGVEELRDALEHSRVVCAGTPAERGKLTAPPIPFSALAELAAYVLVEADGSRGLPFKAHAAHEPAIPPEAQRVVLVLGAGGFGKPVRDVCHRPELYAQRAGLAMDAPVTPEAAARVIRAEGYGDRLLVNQVEDEARYRLAAELAGLLSCPVTAGSLHKEVYLCLR